MGEGKLEKNSETLNGILDPTEISAIDAITSRAKERMDQGKSIKRNETLVAKGEKESPRQQLADLFEKHLSLKFSDKNSKEANEKIGEGLDNLLFDFVYDMLKKSNNNEYDVDSYRDHLKLGYYLLKLKNPDIKDMQNDPWTMESALRAEFTKNKNYKDELKPEDKIMTSEEYDLNKNTYSSVNHWKVVKRTITTETPQETEELLGYKKEFTQNFYRGDAQPEDEKTQAFVGEKLGDLENIAKNIQNNPEIDQSTVKLVISGSASNIRYTGEYKDNPGLALGRANNLKEKIEGSRKSDQKPSFDIQSEVAGPIFPPTADLLKTYFPDGEVTVDNCYQEPYVTTMEEKIYRQYQKVSIKFDFELKDKTKEIYEVQKPSDFQIDIGENDKRPAAEVVVDLGGKYQLLQLGNESTREFHPISSITYNFKLGNATHEVNEMQTNKGEVVSQTPMINITPYQYILLENLLTPRTFTKVEEKFYYNKMVGYKYDPAGLSKFLVEEIQKKNAYYATNKLPQIDYAINKSEFNSYSITSEEKETLKKLFS